MMKLGVLGAADIAFRRFLPALQKSRAVCYAGTASRTPGKAARFEERFGGRLYSSYEDLLSDETVDAVYLPLPPALHFEWGKKALAANKHLLLEKPFTTSLRETEYLLHLSEEKGLAVYENYMFLQHSQLKTVQSLIANGTLGEIRLYRMSFGFPLRSTGDFRYSRDLGGGALLDCGGYPIRLAWELLGETAYIDQSNLTQPDGSEVDLFGCAVLKNEKGLCAQISFGMDNAYQCQLEVWANKMTLIAPRIFTAGPDFEPKLILRTPDGKKSIFLEKDDAFLHSIEKFSACARDPQSAAEERAAILRQAELTEYIQGRHIG